MPNERTERIWELDAARGFFLLCMVVIHFIYDLTAFVGIPIREPAIYVFIQQNGGVLFILISGICVTLGHRSALRGGIVLGCGLLITAVTWATDRLGVTEGALIVFGVLHLLGICMLLWPLFRRLPNWALAVLGVLLAFAGYVCARFTVACPYLFPFGLTAQGFASADYFPLLPHLGWFLIGAALGRTAYREKKSLLPALPKDAAVIRFFRLCGRQSLLIYLLHQPVLFVLAMGIGRLVS